MVFIEDEGGICTRFSVEILTFDSGVLPQVLLGYQTIVGMCT